MIQKSEQPKILLFDIETSPIIGAVWGLWEQNVVKVVDQWYILSFSYKWLGENKVYSFALPDFKLYSKNKTDDSALCNELWKLLDEADIVIAHNGDEFDLKKANARFIVNGMVPPSSYLKIDTKKIAKKYFKFDSNSLKDLAKYFGVRQKADAGGIETWFGCMAGDKKAWAHMVEYNKQDVRVLEDVYLRMRPWMNSHPVLRHREDFACPKCLSTNIQKRGYERTVSGIQYQRWQCQNCGGWSKSRKREEEKSNII